MRGAPGRGLAPRIADLGTGSGAIALALATELPRARICGIDRSAGALRVAARNVGALGCGGRVSLVAGDLFEPLRTERAGGGFDVVVSNPPYIPSATIAALPPEIAWHEPREALDGGPDGLRYHRRIIEAAPDYLRSGGWLALEVGDGQAAAVTGLIDATHRFEGVRVARDLAGRERVVLARHAGGSGG